METTNSQTLNKKIDYGLQSVFVLTIYNLPVVVKVPGVQSILQLGEEP